MAASEAPPTLRALLTRRDLALSLDSGTDTAGGLELDREIRFVHSSDLVDPTPFLSEGVVLLTTGTQFLAAGEDQAFFDAYVGRLSGRGVIGLGFGTEVVRDGIPAQLSAACRALGMPLFIVPYRTPFIAVARANADASAARAYARRTWALAAQRAISLAALRPDGLGATLDELSRQLGSWVGLYDASGSLAREHPPGGLDSTTLTAVTAEAGAVLTRGVRAGSTLRLGDRPFSLQTLGRGGRLRGVIAIATESLDEEGRGVVTSVIAMAGLALEQHEGLARARGMLRTGLVQMLVGGEHALARRIARDQWQGFPAAPLTIAAAAPGARRLDAASEWLELRASESQGAVFYGRDTDVLIMATPASDAALAGEFAETFACRVGVSGPVTHAAFAEGRAQAVAALRRGTERVTRFASLAASGVLSVLDSDTARAIATEQLAPLQSHDDGHRTQLVETLRAWLEHDARIDGAAAALSVHRHTVRARIAQAEKLLGADLTSFPVRAELWAALRATSSR